MDNKVKEIIQQILNDEKISFSKIMNVLPYANELLLIRIISKYKTDIIKHIKNPSYPICYFSVLKNKRNIKYVPHEFVVQIYKTAFNF